MIVVGCNNSTCNRNENGVCTRVTIVIGSDNQCMSFRDTKEGENEGKSNK